MKIRRDVLQYVALSIMLMLLIGLGCKRLEQVDEKRITVALPQWFYPSEERPWLDEVWKTIREENPGWILDLELVAGQTEQVLQKLRVVHASGEGPDLACVRLDSMPMLVEQGMLQPMETPLLDEEWQTMVPAISQSVEGQGKRYGLPYDIGVRVILYRTDLFEKQGIPAPSETWTWDDLVADAKKLTQDLDGDGTIDQWGFGVPGARSRKSVLQWLPWFWSLGGDLEPEGGQVTLSSPAAVEAMQWYRDLAYRYRVTPPTLYSMDQDTVFQGMASGLFAITEGGSWEIAMLEKHSIHHDKIRIAPLPRPHPGGASVTLVDGWGFGFLSRDREKTTVLARILARLSSAEHQLAKYRASGMLSPFQPLYQDPLFTRNPEASVLARVLQTARPAPPIPSFPAVSEALEMVMQEVLMEDVRPEEALAEQDEGLRKRRIQDP
jgi:multiple sugar transport system substrate-binding protein